MWKIRLYLSQILFVRWVVAAIGLVLLLGLLDSLALSNEIAASEEGNALRYTLLRAPVIFDQVFIFTLMIAILLTYLALIQRNELVAVQGFGLSLLAQIRLLAPIVLLITIFSAILIDTRVPPSVRALNTWGIGDYEGGNITDEEPLWLNDQGTFVLVTGREGENELTGITFFQRGEFSEVQAVTWAERAVFEGDHWSLSGLERLSVFDASVAPLTRWNTRQRPAMIDRLAAEPRDLSVVDLDRFAKLRGSGSRPSAAYRVWRMARLSLPLTGLALLVFAVPIMQQVQRRSNGTIPLVIALGVTFLFMVFDGIAKTLGAAGAFPTLAAAMGASVILGLAGLYLTLRQESLN